MELKTAQPRSNFDALFLSSAEGGISSTCARAHWLKWCKIDLISLNLLNQIKWYESLSKNVKTSYILLSQINLGVVFQSFTYQMKRQDGYYFYRKIIFMLTQLGIHIKEIINMCPKNWILVLPEAMSKNRWFRPVWCACPNSSGRPWLRHRGNAFICMC